MLQVGEATKMVVSARGKENVSGQRQETAFAVFGLGRFGESLARALTKHKCRILGIDKDAVVVQRLSPQFPCVVLDATDEDALREADVGDFDTAVVAIGSDFESNLLATVALKNVGVDRVICQSATEYQSETLLKVGADRVIDPEADAGEWLARDIASHDREQLLVGPGYAVSRLMIPKAVGGQRLAQLGLSRREVQVLAIQRGDVSLVQPPADTVLNEGDLLVVLGLDEVIGKLDQFWGTSMSEDKKP